MLNSFDNVQCEEVYFQEAQPETLREALQFAGYDVAPYGDAPQMPIELSDFNPSDVSDDYDFNATKSAELLSPLPIADCDSFDDDE